MYGSPARAAQRPARAISAPCSRTPPSAPSSVYSAGFLHPWRGAAAITRTASLASVEAEMRSNRIERWRVDARHRLGEHASEHVAARADEPHQLLAGRLLGRDAVRVVGRVAEQRV